MSNDPGDHARAAAEEIAVKVLYSVGQMIGGSESEEMRRELHEFLSHASIEAVKREFSETIDMLVDRIGPIIERHMEVKLKEINDALRLAPCTCYDGDVCGRCKAMGIIARKECAP